jgi:hypothetical protein
MEQVVMLQKQANFYQGAMDDRIGNNGAAQGGFELLTFLEVRRACRAPERRPARNTPPRHLPLTKPMPPPTTTAPTEEIAHDLLHKFRDEQIMRRLQLSFSR